MSRNKHEPAAHVGILCEFFEIAVHNILYTRKLYPDSIFARTKKYGVIVYQCLHPPLAEYITNCLKAVEYHAKQNQLSKLILCFFALRTVFEKYVFDIRNLSAIDDSDAFLVKLEQNFRDLCLKLHSSRTELPPIPDDTNFTIQIVTTDYSSALFNRNPGFSEFPWIHVKPNDNKMESCDIIPLHTIDSDFMNLQVYIECGNINEVRTEEKQDEICDSDDDLDNG